MKGFQENLLVVLALGLCGLCVYQWRGQTVQRNEIERLDQLVSEKAMAIQGYTNSIKTLDQQIAATGTQLTDLRDNAKKKEELIANQKREIGRLLSLGEGLTNQIAEYKNGLGLLETKLKEAYEGIKKQNEAMQEIVAQRDEFVKKYNDSIRARNEVVSKYNELADQFEKMQSGKK